MPRSASKLAPTSKGGFVARKVIPLDVHEEYAKLYGRRTEERLNTGPMPVPVSVTTEAVVPLVRPPPLRKLRVAEAVWPTVCVVGAYK